MHQVILPNLGKQQQKRLIIFSVVALILIALTTILIVHIAQPTRSTTNYCRVYEQEKARLSRMSNQSNPYPTGVFNASVSDAGQIAASFGQLNRVAPSNIESEVSGLQRLYQDIHDNPSHAASDSLSGGSLDDSLKAWTQQNCK